jgi:hypothetical protein
LQWDNALTMCILFSIGTCMFIPSSLFFVQQNQSWFSLRHLNFPSEWTPQRDNRYCIYSKGEFAKDQLHLNKSDSPLPKDRHYQVWFHCLTETFKFPIWKNSKKDNRYCIYSKGEFIFGEKIFTLRNTNWFTRKVVFPLRNTNWFTRKVLFPLRNTNLYTRKVLFPLRNTNLYTRKVLFPLRNTNWFTKKVLFPLRNTNLYTRKVLFPFMNTNWFTR